MPVIRCCDPCGGFFFHARLQVAVADTATAQVKVFSPTTGELAHTIGAAGGFADGVPAVDGGHGKHIRLNWTPFNTSSAHSSLHIFLAHEGDGSLWIADQDNRRVIHVSADGAELLGATMNVPASYTSTVMPEDPTRVFSNFLEFSVDYGKPLNESCAVFFAFLFFSSLFGPFPTEYPRNSRAMCDPRGRRGTCAAWRLCCDCDATVL